MFGSSAGKPNNFLKKMINIRKNVLAFSSVKMNKNGISFRLSTWRMMKNRKRYFGEKTMQTVM